MPIHRANRLGPILRRARPSAAILLLACLLALLTACGETAVPTIVPQPVAVAAVASPWPTAAPSATPAVTATPTASPCPSATPTSTVTPTLAASATAAARPSPTATRTSTASPSPSATDAPSVTPTPTLPLYDAAYVADVTIPDGTVIEPGTPFTKTWRLRNTGNAPWEEGMALMLAAGEAMGAPEAVPVPATAPGETADVSVAMVAPKETGAHSAAWRLCRGEACLGGAVTLQIVSRAALAARGPAVEVPMPAVGGACPYIGNRNSMKFHRADCRWVREMNEANKVCFQSREEAIAAGYVPCKVCKP
jgi:hypothetical protein